MKPYFPYLALLALNGFISANEMMPSKELLHELPELKVTASLWEADLSSITASTTMLNSTELETGKNLHFQDLIYAIPNLTSTGGSSRPRYFQMRGIGENSQFEGETPDSSIRFLIDDLDFTGLGTIGNLFDLQQVEVLRGPQAGAFGVNAAGGLIKLVGNEPTPYWTGQLETTLGQDNLFGGGIALGGPLLEYNPEALTFRLALYQLNSDGFRENKFLNQSNTNERNEFNSRLKIRWEPSSTWTWDGTLIYADINNGYDDFALNNHYTHTYSDEPGRDEQKSVGTSIRGTYYGSEQIEVRSISQFNSNDSTYSYDADWGAGNVDAAGTIFESGYFGFLNLEREREVASQEIRIDSVEKQDALGFIDRWTTGIYFNVLDEYSALNYRDEFGSGIATSKYETENIALFGQFAHDLNLTSRLILGLRYEYHEVDFTSNVTEDYFGTLASGLTATNNADDLWGGILTFEHNLTPKQTLFTNITLGYKAGGANSSAFTTPGDPLTYKKETLWNYELGLHSSWLNDSLTSKVTLFYLDREDAQLRDSSGAGGFFRYFTSNKGDARHYGLEAEATWNVHPFWTFSTSIGLLDAKLDSTGAALANAPSYTYRARADFYLESGFFANVELAGSDAYRESNSHDQERSAYTIFNSEIGYRHNNWKFALWGRNLFNKQYENRIFYFDNYDPDGGGIQRYESPADPQQFGVTLNYIW